MKRPITDRMRYLQRLISQVLEDMEMLLNVYSEEEAKLYIELLGEINVQYCVSRDQIGERLQALSGWDLEV